MRIATNSKKRLLLLHEKNTTKIKYKDVSESNIKQLINDNMRKLTTTLFIITMFALHAGAWVTNLYGDYELHTMANEFGVPSGKYQTSAQNNYKYYSENFEIYAFLHMSSSVRPGLKLLWANKMPVVSGSDATATGVAYLVYMDKSGNQTYLNNAITYSYTGNGWTGNILKSLELTYCVLDNNSSYYYLQTSEGDVTTTYEETKDGVKYYKATIDPYFPTTSINIEMGIKSSQGLQSNALSSNMGWQKCGGIVITKWKVEFYSSSTPISKIVTTARSQQAIAENYQAQINKLSTRYEKTSGADVNEDGVVNAADVVSVYNTIIDGNYAATHTYKDHHYIDLELPSGTLWATCNQGAVVPEDFGDYFAWGEMAGTSNIPISRLNGRKDFGAESHHLCSSAKSIGEGGDLPTSSTYVNSEWGGQWRMPTADEFKELINKEYTTTETCVLNGARCLKVTSRKNNQSIYLPCGGMGSGAEIIGQGSTGWYWSSTLNLKSSSDYYSAHCFAINPMANVGTQKSYYGMCVRPVVSKEYVK